MTIFRHLYRLNITIIAPLAAALLLTMLVTGYTQVCSQTLSTVTFGILTPENARLIT